MFVIVIVWLQILLENEQGGKKSRADFHLTLLVEHNERKKCDNIYHPTWSSRTLASLHQEMNPHSPPLESQCVSFKPHNRVEVVISPTVMRRPKLVPPIERPHREVLKLQPPAVPHSCFSKSSHSFTVTAGKTPSQKHPAKCFSNPWLIEIEIQGTNCSCFKTLRFGVICHATIVIETKIISRDPLPLTVTRKIWEVDMRQYVCDSSKVVTRH